jgi:hypothetical protein
MIAYPYDDPVTFGLKKQNGLFRGMIFAFFHGKPVDYGVRYGQVRGIGQGSGNEQGHHELFCNHFFILLLSFFWFIFVSSSCRRRAAARLSETA